ncbi:hypothetical protein QAD02_020776 [Eretmocerus hayati]|uniref:Uncharacterized protein n=1 Tax=Eretmocerus hayati TaxID=131215 RepID=A0ACC2PND8_9HYME|nr:hypothetical protein QAD02_020776 [Eretmocerus hayati]
MNIPSFLGVDIARYPIFVGHSQSSSIQQLSEITCQDDAMVIDELSTQNTTDSFSQLSLDDVSSSNVVNCEVNLDQKESSEEPTPQESVDPEFRIGGRLHRNQGIRGRTQFLTERLISALDYSRVSHRQAVHILSAVFEALGIDAEKMVMNKSSFDEIRSKMMKEQAGKIRDIFQDTTVFRAGIIHWDTKLIVDNSTYKAIDRMPVCFTDGPIHMLIGAPALEDGKGVTQAHEVVRAADAFGLRGKIKALCCDTTNSNLRARFGVALIIEQLLDSDLLYSACRHHVFELLLGAVFQAEFPGTKGPDVVLFKKFQKSWDEIDHGSYKSGLAYEEIDPRGEPECPKKLIINNESDLEALSGKDMDSFINSSSLRFFERFQIKTDFLQLGVESWDTNPDFLDGLEVVRKLRVVNDTAERAVKLTEEYINRTEDEELKQALLLTIPQYKRAYPDANKSTVVKKNKQDE